MSSAYIETTILTDVLLKPGSKKHAKARSALAKYDTTLLPVYAIKEWKAGPLDDYAYFHDKLVMTNSLADTLAALNALVFMPYKKSTCYEAFEAATRLVTNDPNAAAIPARDSDLADRYRLVIRSLICRSWRRRRRMAKETIQELECYTEAEPSVGKDGLFDLTPKACAAEHECCLASRLKARPDLLTAMRSAIPESSPRKEDKRRRKALKKLINTPKAPLDRENCRYLGDAIFAFFCPVDATILTTNDKDHKPLAEAIHKKARSPRDIEASPDDL